MAQQTTIAAIWTQVKLRARRPAFAGGLFLLTVMLLLLVARVGKTEEHDGSDNEPIPNLHPFHDPSGTYATFNTAGDIDTSGPFFQDLGTNGRRCVTCHEPNDAWTITPAHIQERFDDTDGRDPLFRTNDGSTCPSADVSTQEARRKAYTLLLNKGLIRVELAVPANAEYTVLNADNPYACTSTTAISVYRRPLPATNIPFLSTVMWDGRETFKDTGGKFLPVPMDLAHQAVDATMGHAQGAHPPTDDQVKQIVDFETKLFTTQVHDRDAGRLNGGGALGGPTAMAAQQFFFGINDPLGGNPTGAPFSPEIFSIFSKWADISDRDFDEHTEARRAVARGEHLFNTLPISITGVAGLNDALHQPVINGFCGTCHDSPNVGDHSIPVPLNIGLADASKRTLDLPLITLKNNTTGEVLQVSDPGRALITGKWADVGKFKGPILRNLAARAPYFHNGSAATLLDAVNFYDTRFQLHLSAGDKADLIAFLKTL